MKKRTSIPEIKEVSLKELAKKKYEHDHPYDMSKK